MAISETTKQEVSRMKSSLQSQYQKNLADIQSHQSAIAKLQAANQALKVRRDALVADISEPTPVEE